VIVAVDGRVGVIVTTATVVVVMIVPVMMGVRFLRFGIVAAAAMVVMVLVTVGMSMIMRMIMGVTARRSVVVVMIVIAGIPMGVIVGADADGAVAMDEVEGAEEEEADPGNQGVDAEAGIEVFLDAAGRVEGEEESSPDQEGEDREQLQKFFHGRKSWRDDR